MKYNYQARTKTGEIQSGLVEASSREAAVNVLKSAGLYVTFLRENYSPFYSKKLKLFKKITKKEIVAFSRQLSIMFKSEIPLAEILDTLAKQTTNEALKEKILEMIKKVEGGDSLSKTFSNYPKIFNPFYINMVKSGEASGKLSDVFSYLSDHLEREYHFYGQIKGAMIYPAFVLFVFLLVGGAMIFFIMPQISQLLDQEGGEVPLVTQILLGLGDFLIKWAWLIILIVASLVSGLVFYIRTKEGKTFFDGKLLKVPMLGNFLKKTYLSRFALNLSTLISGGLPIVQSLEICSDVVGNEIYKLIILKTIDGVKKGERISSILEKYPKEIPPLFIQMVGVGEKTGRLGFVLTNVVDFYQKEVERTLNSFVRFLEPLLILVFGLLVGGLMAAVIIPLYQMMGGM